jgi:hypothetical protein
VSHVILHIYDLLLNVKLNQGIYALRYMQNSYLICYNNENINILKMYKYLII